MLTLREFAGETEVLIKFMENLQDYLVKIDPAQRLRRPPEYGELYVSELLEKIQDNEGMIYLAELDEKPVGMIAGIIEKPSEMDQIDHIPTKVGNILELIVDENCRGQGLGQKLMEKMEDYFRTQNCDTAWVDVFVPNQSAHHFYQKENYQDRLVGMIKKLS
ncbi:MAG TPA: GNAT family N-acetyltransferase [Candidatus Gracilibacteria bacterium]|nr:GNAT family N-acetyltransferase [Candidatus Gracilibacteria bacterium]